LKVSGQVIVMTLPGLFVPFLGGVLIDRIDRRYLGVLLDSRTRRIRPRHGVHRLARPFGALAPLRHDVDYRHRFRDVLGDGERAGCRK